MRSIARSVVACLLVAGCSLGGQQETPATEDAGPRAQQVETPATGDAGPRAQQVETPATGDAGARVRQKKTPATAAAGPRTEHTVNVMSFNIRYGTANDGDNAWQQRREAVVEVIDAFRVDVLGVQEALRFQLDELEQALPRYRRIGVGRDDGAEAGEYAAILIDASRFEVLDEGTFWFSPRPGEPGSTGWGNDIPRICTWARLRDGATGNAFSVYNVHWDHRSQPSRERAAELLLARVAQQAAGEAVLITGDFNAGESNPAFEALLHSTAIPLIDTFRDARPGATEVGTFNGFAGTTSGDKIDAVLASDHWVVVAADIVRSTRRGRYPSDHFPVVATLLLR